jgi:hypothetical protein
MVISRNWGCFLNNFRYLFFYDKIQYFEEDKAAEKGLDLPARSRFGEGRAEPLRHLTMDLDNFIDKLKNCVIKLKFNKFLIS